MSMTFAEPGGDADFLVGTTNGFWASVVGIPAVATDFVHGGHIKSIKHRPATNDIVRPPSVLLDTGSRISIYIYLVALPTTAKARLFYSATAGAWRLYLTTAGVLQLWNGTTAQVGTNGATLSTGQWYRISLAYTFTSTTVNRLELFVDGVSSISITNATFAAIGSITLNVGNGDGNAGLDFRSSDFYIDDSSALTDTGNIWVTAKRPVANGTTNGFTGSGTDSGYGAGNSIYVNERPLAVGGLVSIIGAGSAITEEYNIEGKAVGDIDISAATIIDWCGWASMSSLVGEALNLIIDGANVAKTTTSSAVLYTAIKGSATYPAGAGTDIGITTDTSLTTVSLYECGVIVAYIPVAPPATATGNMLLVF